MAYVKNSAEFKQEVCNIIRGMPLKEMLLIPDSFVESALTAWLEKNEETGISQAQEEYKQYYHMLMSLPEDIVMLDVDLYIFKVARRVLDTLMKTIIETQYYNNISKHADMLKEDAEFFVEVVDQLAERIEEDLESSSKEQLKENLKNIRDTAGTEDDKGIS